MRMVVRREIKVWVSISRTRWNVDSPKRMNIPKQAGQTSAKAPKHSVVLLQAHRRRNGLPFLSSLTGEDNSKSEPEGSIQTSCFLWA